MNFSRDGLEAHLAQQKPAEQAPRRTVLRVLSLAAAVQGSPAYVVNEFGKVLSLCSLFVEGYPSQGVFYDDAESGGHACIHVVMGLPLPLITVQAARMAGCLPRALGYIAHAVVYPASNQPINKLCRRVRRSYSLTYASLARIPR